VKGEYNGYITAEKLIETITGKDVWTPKAEFGSAFHLVMEKGADPFWNESAQKYIIDVPQAGTVICEYSEIELADEFHKAYGAFMTWETWHKGQIKVDHHTVILNMRIDGLLGQNVHENKTTTREFKPDFYERSLQWRIYLMAMETSMVQYNIFPYKEPAPLKEGKTKRRAGARELREVKYQPVKFYHGGEPMIQEVESNIRGLISWCERNNLLDYITAKPMEVIQ
jgi:hypothetical protein